MLYLRALKWEERKSQYSIAGEVVILKIGASKGYTALTWKQQYRYDRRLNDLYRIQVNNLSCEP